MCGLRPSAEAGLAKAPPPLALRQRTQRNGSARGLGGMQLTSRSYGGPLPRLSTSRLGCDQPPMSAGGRLVKSHTGATDG